MLKQKFIEQNHGQLLEQLVSQRTGIAEQMIITLEELNKATRNFDKDLVVGGGGHGTVYKGILSNQHIVAIKKPKKVLSREIDEFINEVAILSQINHKNVLKLYGFCLETEVPMLVYEFISNGTLYDYLHVEGPISLSWNNRLRIATETAKSLAYLHTTVAVPIIHRDVKSANILLDDTLTVKVADFGASRYIPMEKSGLTTRAQGTRGYWDPMYFYTGRLTAKRNLLQILDPQVIEEGGKEVQEVAAIATACVKLSGEDRPTMRQVELMLEGICASEEHILDKVVAKKVYKNGIEVGVQSNKLVRKVNEGSTRRYSMEEEFILSASYPRQSGLQGT
ncbi:wall-associated receptor kinase 3-like [Triticum aestivum]|uniref:wall-associated receptor kinase 3-like n=1 Tax=Triticum aestivum TaxID=4565 RepID=UPI001D00F03D|nr:wall-associated receptor kinase 3-like [Triticum aestivum]